MGATGIAAASTYYFDPFANLYKKLEPKIIMARDLAGSVMVMATYNRNTDSVMERVTYGHLGRWHTKDAVYPRADYIKIGGFVDMESGLVSVPTPDPNGGIIA